MKAKISFGIMIVALLMTQGVLAYYPGETHIFPNDMGIENLVYTIIDNNTAIPDLNITINSTNVIIAFPGDMPPGSFKIVFIEEQTKEVVKVVRRGGGGGTRTKYVDRNVTVEKPVFYDRNVTETVEVEKVVDKIEYQETGYKLWHLVLAAIMCLLFGIFFGRSWGWCK